MSREDVVCLSLSVSVFRSSHLSVSVVLCQHRVAPSVRDAGSSLSDLIVADLITTIHHQQNQQHGTDERRCICFGDERASWPGQRAKSLSAAGLERRQMRKSVQPLTTISRVTS